MLHVTTYQLKPYLLIGETPEKYVKPGTDWIRNAVKGLMHQKSAALKALGVQTQLFHNHDEQTGKTLAGYPKIIYHYTANKFLVTGIDEGAFALDKLFEQYPPLIRIGNDMIISAHPTDNQDVDVGIMPSARLFRVGNYLPFNSVTHKQYLAEPVAGKMQLLESTMIKHFQNDTFKFLDINVTGLEVKILDILKLDRKLLTYKNHQYLPFSLVFSLNINLPQYLAIGNGKAFGYGIIERLDEPGM
jgi:hypothetical protein